ncbi:MAG: HAMP domain-containing sensor histidine kinase [Clostridiaceae bacterium]|nr:HAMP domain-containing sensor histidine kinase [Clostridiaceae bacterium]
MKHIGTKLFLGFISMAFLTIGILWIIQAGFMRDTYLNERIDAVDKTIRETAQNGSIDYDGLAEQLNVSLIVCDQDGNLTYRSQGLPMMGMMIRTVQSMIPSEADGKAHYVNSLSGSTRYALLGNQTKDGSYLFAVFSLADLDEASSILRRQLWLITLVLVVSSIILAVFLSGKLSKPVRAVTGAARELAAGRLDVRLPVNSQDEIGQLTTALNDLGAELGRTEKLRQELIANVSHELRSPLAVIQGYAEIIRDVTWPDESKRTEQLNIIVDESSRLARVVKDILDYSRLQAGVDKLNIVEFPICPVFEQLMKQYELEAGRHRVTLRVQCPDQTIRFDQDRFEQVMHNLVNNAINHAYPESAVEISAIKQDSISRIEIKSTGDPIPSEAIDKIWERYYRAGRGGSSRPLGTGLGLAIVKSIFDQHKVHYGVSSQNNQTLFWFETCNQANS